MPANWQNGFPECQKTRNPVNQDAVKLDLDNNLNDMLTLKEILTKNGQRTTIEDYSSTASFQTIEA
jgi:hypothetical protein